MLSESRNDGRARSGYLIAAALLIAAVLIFNIDAVRDLSRDDMDLVAILQDASGIRVGTPVRVAGVEVGRVIGIGFLPAGEAAEVALTLRIDRRARPVLREDSDVRAIRLRAIGQPIVQVEAGSPGAAPVHAGDTLRGKPRLDPLVLLDRSRSLPGALDSLLDAASQVQAMAAARSPDLERLRAGLDGALQAADAIARDLEHGSLARMLGPAGAGAGFERLRTRLDEVAAALGPVIERYTGDPAGEPGMAASLHGLSDRVASLRADVDALSARMRAGGGLLDRMARDSALQVAVHGVQAQMDTLRAEAMSILRRMILP